MDEINDLEARIADALTRLRDGIGKVGLAGPEPEEVPEADVPGETADELRARLDEERTVNAQLEERVKALKERQDKSLATLEQRVAAQKAQLAELDAELQRVQAANLELREVAAEMRTALIDETADATLINRAMLAELEAVRAAQYADRAEVDAILGELSAVLEEV